MRACGHAGMRACGHASRVANVRKWALSAGLLPEICFSLQMSRPSGSQTFAPYKGSFSRPVTLTSASSMGKMSPES
jgi:hypothetical protein